MSLIVEDLTALQADHPDDRTVEIHRSGQAIVTLRDIDVLTVLDVLPGWKVPVIDLWAPEFD